MSPPLLPVRPAGSPLGITEGELQSINLKTVNTRHKAVEQIAPCDPHTLCNLAEDGRLARQQWLLQLGDKQPRWHREARPHSGWIFSPFTLLSALSASAKPAGGRSAG